MTDIFLGDWAAVDTHRPKGVYRKNYPYDAFKHLCRSLFKKPNDLFAMLTAYFDDSATEDVAAVAGYIGSEAQWERFNIPWQKLLDEYHVKAMHRSDLENFQGEFAGWTPPKRTEFVKKAQKIIKNRRHRYVPVGGAIRKADFDEVIPAPLRKYVGGYYGMCAVLTFVLANRWSVNAKHSDPIEWVFEAGTTGSGQVRKLLDTLYSNPTARKHFRINRWSFKGKYILPLQAADVVAYETSKNIQNQIVDGGKFYPARLSAIDLLRGDDIKHLMLWNKPGLEKWRKEPEIRRIISTLTN